MKKTGFTSYFAFPRVRNQLQTLFVGDHGEYRKICFIYLFTIVGVGFLLILGIYTFLHGNRHLGSFDIAAALTLAILMIRYSPEKNLDLYLSLGIGVMFLLYLYLFITGGMAGHGFLWSYTFPLFVLFFKGSHKGFFICSFYLVCCLVYLAIDITSDHLQLYDLNFALRFIPSFIVVVIFSVIYEEFRFSSERAHLSIKNSLEEQVAQRTADLEKEILEKEQSKRDAIQAKEDWERTFNAVPAQIAILDKDFNIRRANRALIEALDLPLEEILHQKCYRLIDDSDNPPDNCPHLRLLMDHDTHYENVYIDSLQSHFALTVAPLLDHSGKPIGAVHIAHDITQQKKAEQEKEIITEKLRKSEKMEAIGLMAGGVAHDLNNILTGVINYPELLLLQMSKEHELYKPLKAIRESGKLAAAIISDMLTIARGVVTVKEPHSINALLQQYLDSTACRDLTSSYYKVQLETCLLAQPFTIRCAPVHIQKLVMNLVTNAFESIQDQGTVSLTTNNTTFSPGDQGNPLLAPGEYITLTISDTGVGITEDVIEHIYEPFYTKKRVGKRSGTGLGLAVVWNIVEEHGAVIQVQSGSEGTTFTIYFPLSKEKQAAKHSLDEHIEKIEGNVKVLLVDEQVHQLRMTRDILKFLGLSVTIATGGEEAIKKCTSESYDLIILDMVMNNGINGLQTFREILKLKPHQKIIISSGYAKNDDVNEALQLGASCFLKKPYHIQQLTEAIKNSLAENGM